MTLNTKNLHMCASSKRRDELTHATWSGMDFQGDRPGYTFSTGGAVTDSAVLMADYEALEPPPAYDTGTDVFMDRMGRDGGSAVAALE